MGMLASLIAGFASGETVAAMRRARRAAIVFLLAGVAALCGIGFLIGAAYIWTAGHYGPIAAALIFGIGFLVLAGLIVLVHRLSANTRARTRAKQRNADMAAIGVTTAIAVLPTLLRGRAGFSLLLGPVVALAAYAIYRENVKPRPDDPDAGPG